jgi:hypothetical protein
MNQLEQLLKDNKITKESLAEKTGLSYPTFLKYCKDPETFTIYHLRVIGEQFGWSANKLIKEAKI